MRLWIVGGCAGVSIVLVGCSGNETERTSTPAHTVTVTATAASATATAAPSAISIDLPAANADVTVPIEVRGRANVFEGVLTVELLASNGAVLCQRTVQSTSGTGTPGSWQAMLAVPPPSSPSVATIRAFSRSPRDGSEENIATQAVRLMSEEPPIVIVTPPCNADVAVGIPLTVSGTASVVEASLNVELRTADGEVLASQAVTGDAASPQRGNWTTTFGMDSVPAGTYEVVAFDFSPHDGSRENEFSIPVRITV